MKKPPDKISSIKRPPYLGAFKRLFQAAQSGNKNQLTLLLNSFEFSKEEKISCIPFLLKMSLPHLLKIISKDEDLFVSGCHRLLSSGNHNSLLLLLSHTPPSIDFQGFPVECLKKCPSPEKYLDKIMGSMSDKALIVLLEAALCGKSYSLADKIKQKHLPGPLPHTLIPSLIKLGKKEWIEQSVSPDPTKAFVVFLNKKNYKVCVHLAPYVPLDNLSAIYSKHSALKTKAPEIGALIDKGVINQALQNNSTASPPPPRQRKLI